ncbi:hypothetical protein EVAR_12358_1 [Eumeta japonica]|uniref:Uncharacterized protein n=1 Tax=Eumeta variegata TaxID=151549 RepID=A0A4C1X2U6_EUMVA|nr:hypothetical protein EVAR_12358_1 [Eumeta japonica]
MKYHTLTEYGREVTVSAGPFRSVSESSGGTLPFHRPNPPYIGYTVPSQEAGNALVGPMELRVSMGDGDRLLSDGSPARLALEYAIKRNALFIDNFTCIWTHKVIKSKRRQRATPDLQNKCVFISAGALRGSKTRRTGLGALAEGLPEASLANLEGLK